MSTTNILDLNNRLDALETSSGGGTSDSAKRSDIATEFNTTTAYTAGCYVYHEGKLYQFNTDHAAGDWDPTDVVEANVTDQIVSNKSAIDGLTASDVAYDNTNSGLTTTDVQGAIDEVADNLNNKVIKTKTEDFTTNNSGYIITLPLNVINASIDTYKSLLLCRAEGGYMYAKTFYDNITNSMGQLTANTTYAVSYTYIE